jgi:hypothetical protein
MTAKKSHWEYLGECGVDSGQLMIMDPCYLENQFQKKDFVDHRAYRDVKTGAEYKYRSGDFENYESPISDYDGKTPNQLISEGVWVKGTIANPNARQPGEAESYASISNGTIANDSYQMNYRMGHPGLGVAFRSGYGDGCYPVYGRKNEDGRVAEVRIVMIGDEGEHPYELPDQKIVPTKD